ncbi:sporulation membrane protein YtaF [Paenibacillus turicensis]|uniref:sporulation membrane protein YtaF n=1 Tax=Paenibacillus turicensis TaxID=160487 RepID=UPI003D2955A7
MSSSNKGANGMDSYNLWIIIVIGLASNLDNAGVGIAYGVRNIRIPWYSNLTISFISFLATLVSGLFGNWISTHIPVWISHLIGTVVIVSVGVWVLLQPLANQIRSRHNNTNNFTHFISNPEKADKDQSQSISLPESILLGTALAMNALAGGFNAGITSLNIWCTSLAVGVISYVLLWACAALGAKYIAERFGNVATVISGLLLVLIGINQMF